MVRLEVKAPYNVFLLPVIFQFQNGTIRRIISPTLTGHFILFQFQNGTIRRGVVHETLDY